MNTHSSAARTHLQRTLAALLTLSAVSAGAQNPYLPLWEHIPDGEPHVFEDPDHAGRMRVYVYGSHDDLRTTYCGLDQVVWSAPVDDLTAWRLEGTIFISDRDASGQKLDASGRPDLLYAPDVAERRDGKDGRKRYYLYPNNQAGGRQSMVAVAERPDGPFRVCNWDERDSRSTVGPIGFDPAVLVDDDGRVYAYWGFRRSYAAELDPATMATVKPGTAVREDLISSMEQDGVFRFFEASSIRKIEDKYVLIYSRFTAEGEFGLPTSNYTLAYAYADAPLGPFTYGGTIIDGRGRDLDAGGRATYTAAPPLGRHRVLHHRSRRRAARVPHVQLLGVVHPARLRRQRAVEPPAAGHGGGIRQPRQPQRGGEQHARLRRRLQVIRLPRAPRPALRLARADALAPHCRQGAGRRQGGTADTPERHRGVGGQPLRGARRTLARTRHGEVRTAQRQGRDCGGR